MPSRRALLKAAVLAGAGLVVGRQQSQAVARESTATDPDSADRWPALRLRIPSPDAAPELDLRSDFGATGDGAADDAPAFRALAVAVNAGSVPRGAVVWIPLGIYRVLGDETITFRRPIVLRGAGTELATIQIEYATPGTTFMRATGRGMYSMHTEGLYNGRPGGNRYPDARYSSVLDAPRRGDRGLAVAEPDLFAPGDATHLPCEDYGERVSYTETNQRGSSFLLKQYLEVRSVEGSEVRLDGPLRDDFAGAGPRLYRWQPLVGFGVEHLTILDRGAIPDNDEANTFRALRFDGVQDGWVWEVHFLDNTSIPLSAARSRRIVVSECLFDGARQVGAGGNGYLPELYLTDDSLVEYCTSVGGRHALICNWSCWGNIFRYNRLQGTPNTGTHGAYGVENLYLRNDARGSRMEVGGGGTIVHGHDGPRNTFVENYARVLRVLKTADRDSAFVGNRHVDPIEDHGIDTLVQDDVTVPRGWDGFPYAAFCGYDHPQTAETARPG